MKGSLCQTCERSTCGYCGTCSCRSERVLLLYTIDPWQAGRVEQGFALACNGCLPKARAEAARRGLDIGRTQCMG